MDQPRLDKFTTYLAATGVGAVAIVALSNPLFSLTMLVAGSIGGYIAAKKYPENAATLKSKFKKHGGHLLSSFLSHAKEDGSSFAKWVKSRKIVRRLKDKAKGAKAKIDAVIAPAEKSSPSSVPSKGLAQDAFTNSTQPGAEQPAAPTGGAMVVKKPEGNTP